MAVLALLAVLAAVVSAQNCTGTTCSACTAEPGCGFCWSSQQCSSGAPGGPSDGSTCLVSTRSASGRTREEGKKNFFPLFSTTSSLFGLSLVSLTAGRQAYAWFFGPDEVCPDAAGGCGAQTTCGKCVASSEACGWCLAGGTGKCVPIDAPNGGSSQCFNAPNQPGILNRQCSACQTHASCAKCQAGLHKCFWCPEEQMCLPRDGDDQCHGLSKLPGSCFDCAIYQNSCESCQQQPDCVWCAKSDTCLTAAACGPGNDQATCASQCAKANTCEGCRQLEDCMWDNKCVARGSNPFQSHQCPPPSSRGFDGGSFVGGIFLVLGLAALAVAGYFAYGWYQRTHGSGTSSLVN